MREGFEALQPRNLYDNKNPAMVTHLTPLKRKRLYFYIRRRRGTHARRGNQKARIMDGKLALLYLIVVASITLSYVDEAGSMRRTISDFAMTRIQAAAK